jgi:large subunit ribosomal protein L7/L12
MATATQDTQQYSEKVQDVLDKISGFTLLELSELVSAFEDKFGITAAMAAPVAVAAGGPAAGAAAPEEEAEPVSFKVVLKGFGEKKIQVIKAVRAETTLALKEAKDLVESCPATVKESLNKEDAEKCAKNLTDAGAEVDIQPE